MRADETNDGNTGPKYGRITEEGLSQLRQRIGRIRPIEDPFIRYVNADSIRHVARAIGDKNPLYVDRAYAEASHHSKLVAPPALLYGVAWGSWDMRRGEGLPGVHGLHSGDHWTYYQPLLDGDEVIGTNTLVGVDWRQGAYAGRSVMQTREFNFTNQRDELVARCRMSAVRAEREAGRERGKYSSIPKASYTEAEIAQIDAELAAEEPRGATPRYWEDVAIGDVIPQVLKGPLTVPDMIAWMMGIGSPHIRSGQYWLDYRRRTPAIAVRDPETGILEAVERVHWDRYMAAEIGMPGPYDYGAQRGAWSTHLFTNWAGDTGFLAEIEFQYRGMNFLGDTVRIKGEVVDKWQGLKTGTGYVECKFAGISQRGDVVLPGRAVVVLPSRQNGQLAFPIDVHADGRRF